MHLAAVHRRHHQRAGGLGGRYRHQARCHSAPHNVLGADPRPVRPLRGEPHGAAAGRFHPCAAPRAGLTGPEEARSLTALSAWDLQADMRAGSTGDALLPPRMPVAGIRSRRPYTRRVLCPACSVPHHHASSHQQLALPCRCVPPRDARRAVHQPQGGGPPPCMLCTATCFTSSPCRHDGQDGRFW